MSEKRVKGTLRFDGWLVASEIEWQLLFMDGKPVVSERSVNGDQYTRVDWSSHWFLTENQLERIVTVLETVGVDKMSLLQRLK